MIALFYHLGWKVSSSGFVSFQPLSKNHLVKKITTQNQRVMEKYTNEELLEVLPSSVKETKELTSKQKVVLGQLCVYNGLEIAKKDGYFYRSNKDLCDDCDIKSEHTLIAATRKLEMLGFIDRKKGSRGTGASEYRINEKLIGDYCKTNTANCSDNCSVKLAEMTNRIKELENTVKILVEKIAVIEGRNCSTDKELDKDIEINNNILNNNSLNNILEEADSTKKLEKEERIENFTESQLILTESLASSPLTDSTDTHTSTEDESIPMEQQTIPTEDEQFQQWLQVVNPYLEQLESVQTLAQFEIIKNRLKESGTEYLNNNDYTSSTVIERMNRTVGTALKEKKNKLIPTEMELSDYLRVHNYGSL